MKWLYNALIALTLFFIVSVSAMETTIATKHQKGLCFDASRSMEFDVKKGCDEFQVKIPVTNSSQTKTEYTYIPYEQVKAFIGWEKKGIIEKEQKITLKDARKNDVTVNFTKSNSFEDYQEAINRIKHKSSTPLDKKMRCAINKIVTAFEEKYFDRIQQYVLEVLTLHDFKNNILYKSTITPEIASLSSITPILIVKAFSKSESKAMVIPLRSSLEIEVEDFSAIQQSTGIVIAYDTILHHTHPFYMQECQKNIAHTSEAFNANLWDEKLEKLIPKTCYVYDSSVNVTLSDKHSVSIPATLDGKSTAIQVTTNGAISLKDISPTCYVKTVDGELIALQIATDYTEADAHIKKITQQITRLTAAKTFTEAIQNTCPTSFQHEKMLFAIQLKQLYELKIALENETDKTSGIAQFYTNTINTFGKSNQITGKDLSPLLIVDIQTAVSSNTEKPYSHTRIAIPLSAVYESRHTTNSGKEKTTSDEVTIVQHSYTSTDGLAEKEAITTTNDRIKFVTSKDSQPHGSKNDAWDSELNKVLDQYEEQHYKVSRSDNRFEMSYFAALANDPYYDPFSKTIKCNVYKIDKNCNDGEPSLTTSNEQLNKDSIQTNGSTVSIPGWKNFKATIWQGIQDPGMSIQDKKEELLKNKRYFTPGKIVGFTVMGIIACFMLRKMWRSF